MYSQTGVEQQTLRKVHQEKVTRHEQYIKLSPYSWSIGRVTGGFYDPEQMQYALHKQLLEFYKIFLCLDTVWEQDKTAHSAIIAKLLEFYETLSPFDRVWERDETAKAHSTIIAQLPR